MTLSSSSSALLHAGPQGSYCHNPYAADSGVQQPLSIPTTKQAYCHNPYTLPHLWGQTWEETWSTSQSPAEAQPCPSYNCNESTSAISPSTSNDSLCGDSSQPDTLEDQEEEAHQSESPNSRRLRNASESGPFLASRFPVSLRGRCPHRDYWLRLRGKRGYTYFLCTHCMCGWRKPRDVPVPGQN
eukprot:EG_transcript_12204